MVTHHPNSENYLLRGRSVSLIFQCRSSESFRAAPTAVSDGSESHIAGCGDSHRASLGLLGGTVSIVAQLGPRRSTMMPFPCSDVHDEVGVQGRLFARVIAGQARF